MFVMDNVTEFPAPFAFKMYGRALEWGHPMGGGYRYLSFSQSVLLVRQAGLTDEQFRLYIPPAYLAHSLAHKKVSDGQWKQ